MAVGEKNYKLGVYVCLTLFTFHMHIHTSIQVYTRERDLEEKEGGGEEEEEKVAMYRSRSDVSKKEQRGWGDNTSPEISVSYLGADAPGQEHMFCI